jgi:hypothetical protein
LASTLAHRARHFDDAGDSPAVLVGIVKRSWSLMPRRIDTWPGSFSDPS